MYQAFMVVHVLIGMAIIGLVMLQQGRGADAGAGFGGASNSVFGARGASSFLSRTTAILASVFFASSLALAYMAGNKDNKKADIMDVPAATQPGRQDMPPVAPEPSKAQPESAVPVAPAPEVAQPTAAPMAAPAAEPAPAPQAASAAVPTEKKAAAPTAKKPAKKNTGKQN